MLPAYAMTTPCQAVKYYVSAKIALNVATYCKLAGDTSRFEVCYVWQWLNLSFLKGRPHVNVYSKLSLCAAPRERFEYFHRLLLTYTVSHNRGTNK